MDRGYRPCCHILVIYILVCRCKPTHTVGKILDGSDAAKSLRACQVKAEHDRKRSGYLYPNGTGTGGEFVHLLLTGKSHKLSAAVEKSMDEFPKIVKTTG